MPKRNDIIMRPVIAAVARVKMPRMSSRPTVISTSGSPYPTTPARSYCRSLYARTASTLDGRLVTFRAPATNITTPRMTLAASPTQSRHATARQDVAADALVVAEVGTRKEYRPPLWQASSRKRVLIVGRKPDKWSTVFVNYYVPN